MEIAESTEIPSLLRKGKSGSCVHDTATREVSWAKLFALIGFVKMVNVDIEMGYWKGNLILWRVFLHIVTH